MPQQRDLFDTDPAPWEMDEAIEKLVATVVFAEGPAEPFDYRVPERLRRSISVGCRVRVPLGRGNRRIVGYCVEVKDRPATRHRLKDIQALVDERSLFSPAMLRLTRWMADYYLCTWGQVLGAVVPAGVRSQAGTREKMIVWPAADAATRRDEQALPKKQSAVLEHLLDCGRAMTAAELALAVGCTHAPIKALLKKGLILGETRRVRDVVPVESSHQPEENLVLNQDQQAALEAITASLASGRHETILIHGVTGSGKTEVYIQAIDEVIRYGRQAIVLVPEISLTPQTERRFRRRFDRVAVLHSHLSNVERHWHWEQVAAGRVHVVVGARSAVFAPVPHLGLIVIDEEHENSFKQDSTPRYHARTVARRRAETEGVPLVLGSATPSLESWQAAQSGTYRLVRMPRRIFDRPMPAVGTIDLRTDAQQRGWRGAIGRQLHVAMRQALEDGGQVILLLNRRGFSTHIQCPACGYVARCPHCDIALTHHRQEETALCHYCDFRQPAPRECPDCKFGGIRYRGLGTQRLEAEVRARFPDHECLRMDTDSMRRPGSHDKALARFKAGEVRILLGTQMIAKGLDFPDVTLVGVINADTALHLPDFRAAERTFQLVTQVAGRTGRSERGGRVLVQTFSPDHVAIVAAARHDFSRFAAAELPVRRSLCYPPFSSMVRIVLRGADEDATRGFASELAGRLKSAAAGLAGARILGPAPAPIARLRDLFRFAIQLQSPDRAALCEAVRSATTGLKAPDGIQWIADVDPLDML